MTDDLSQILLVEDNSGDARLLREMLQEAADAPFELIHVAQLGEALQYLDEVRPDVVLLDLGLPDEQGFDTFLRAQVRAPHVPFVVLTGTDDKAIALKAVRHGAQDYLVKGQFDSELLARAVYYAMERKRVETHNQRLLQEASLFNEIAVLMASAKDTSDALQEACAKLAIFLQVPQAGFAVLNPERTVAEVIADYRPADSPGALGIMLPVVGNPAMEHILEHQTPLAVADAQTDPRMAPVHDVMRQRKVASILIVPVMVGGQVLGTLGFDTYERHIFADSEIDLVQRAASQMGQVVRRKQAEEASEEAYDIIRMSPAVAFLWRNDEGWPVEYVTENVEAVFGYTREEFISGRILYSGIVHPDDLERVAREVGVHCQEEGGVEFVHEPYRIITKDGLVRWLDDRTCIRRDETGRISHYQGIVLDITERRQAEEALRASEELFRLLFEYAPSGMAITDLEGRYVRVNPSCCAMLGYTEKELLERSYMDVTYAEDLHANVAWRDAAEQGEVPSFELEKRFVTRQDDIVCALLRATLVRDALGQPLYFIGQIVDITERKRAEEALRQERDRAQKYLDVAGVLIVALDAKGEVTLINRKGSEILGYEQEEIIGRSWFDSCLPASMQEGVRTVFRRLMAGESEPVEYYENLVLTKRGEQRIIAWHNTILMDDEGTIVGTLSSGEDITERKRAEEKLQASLREKEVLLKEVHHRVKNNLQVISSLLDLQSASITDPRILRMFRESQNRIRAMGLIHEKLYRSSDLANIEAAGYFEELVERLLGIYGGVDQLISPVLDVDDVLLTIDLAIPFGLIINELVSNTLKHAFPPDWKGEGLIRVKLRVEAGDRLALSVSDNGIGFPADLDLHSLQTLGLQIVDLLTHQLGGTIHLDRGAGTTFTITCAANGQAVSDGERR
jgi:PAS domain S-box-containing protein